MKPFFVVFLIAFSFTAFAQQSVGVFQFNEDIGHPKLEGGASYDEQTQTYTISGAGTNIWFNRDEFHYLYNKLSGDFILTADFEFSGDLLNANGHCKVGWMVRESNDEGAASMNAVKHFDGLCLLQWRPFRGMFMRDPQEEIFFPKKGRAKQTIQLKRIGNTFTMKMAHPGEPLQLVGSADMDLTPEVLAGIYICSHDSDAVAKATVRNVRIAKPIINKYSSNPYVVNKPVQEVTGSCQLEILDISTGNRQIIYESKSRFEAPNWMPDGKKLLFNQEGHLYTIPVIGGTPEMLNTGSVTRNNNDHGISFDGKMLAISSHRAGLPGGGSTVYTLPISGGEPKLVTQNTPSYFHGWNPNGKELSIVAQRDGKDIYNIYKVSVKDGKETVLTSNKIGHVDGCEYSPDGKYIYYNSNISGTMQVWRMKNDGSDKEQLTFDEFHNWFPHISPDGNLMVFLSYPQDIDPKGHPFYKEVMLRVMRLNAPGAPKVVAHLYGGQGTINVNSWSPDSKRIAFVSNTGADF